MAESHGLLVVWDCTRQARIVECLGPGRQDFPGRGIDVVAAGLIPDRQLAVAEPGLRSAPWVGKRG
jgi:hypothetical protein